MSEHSSGTVVEVVISRLKPGVSHEDFERVMNLAQGRLMTMPGFQRRLPLAGAGGLVGESGSGAGGAGHPEW
jgi:hypothetical protein